jgi:hypothetical protein
MPDFTYPAYPEYPEQSIGDYNLSRHRAKRDHVRRFGYRWVSRYVKQDDGSDWVFTIPPYEPHGNTTEYAS